MDERLLCTRSGGRGMVDAGLVLAPHILDEPADRICSALACTEDSREPRNVRRRARAAARSHGSHTRCFSVRCDYLCAIVRARVRLEESTGTLVVLRRSGASGSLPLVSVGAKEHNDATGVLPRPSFPRSQSPDISALWRIEWSSLRHTVLSDPGKALCPRE